MANVLPEVQADKMIQDKIKEWETAREQLKTSKKAAAIQVHPFLTISRDFGCGEETLIPLIEKTLNWKVYGKNLLDHMARRDYLNRGLIETLDEQHKNLLDQWITFLVRTGSILPNDYIVRLSKMMKVIISHESAIFVGRGANYILGDKNEGLFIKLTAPFEYRVQHIAQLRELPKKETESLVRTIDEERREFIKQFFKKDREDASYFDIIFNTKGVSADSICDYLAVLLKARSEPQ
jgi:cytidylate kinase-like protein